MTLPEKLWRRHLVHETPGEPDLLYIDLHLVHKVTSPQAFDSKSVAVSCCRFVIIITTQNYLFN